MADILLVEDKESLRRVLRLTLENAGYSVPKPTTPGRAERNLHRSSPPVLTDLRMPHGSGLDVLRARKPPTPTYRSS